MGLSDSINKKKTKEVQQSLPRWKRIMELPDSTILIDLVTDKKYLKQHLKPIFMDNSHRFSDEFMYSITGERVWAPFLRLKADYDNKSKTDSLMKRQS